MSSLRCALIQTDLVWENKSKNLELLEKKITALEEGIELIVLPEMFTTGFSMNVEALAESMEGESIQWMKRMSRTKKAILAGSMIIEENGRYYNRLIWMLPNGQFGHYDKRHLFGYAHEDKHFTEGNRRVIASVNGWKINLQICYDLRFPVWSRQQRNPDADFTYEYDVLIYVANWPSSRAYAWKRLLTARAIENQCYVIGVNRVGVDGNNHTYSGDSVIIDPLGEALKDGSLEKSDHTEKSIVFSLSKDHLNDVRKKFPFLKDADDFMLSN